MFRVPTAGELKRITKPDGKKGEWGPCGIAAMSAATGIPAKEIYIAIPNWPGHTPSKMVISTLKHFGYECERVLVPKIGQMGWPIYNDEFPSRVAMGRIYWGTGKWDGSHWITIRWLDSGPGVYDSALGVNFWFDALQISFEQLYHKDIEKPEARLKSLYFIWPNGRKKNV